MNVKELKEKLDLQYICNEGLAETKDVTGCYCGDLLSWVMSRATEGDAWLTVMGNVTSIGVAVLKGALRVYDYIQKQLLYEITVNSTIGEYYLHYIGKEYIITNKAKNEIALVCVNTKKVLGTFPIAIAHMFDKGIALQDGRYIIASQKAFVVITPNALDV